MDLDVAAFAQARWERYCHVSAVTLIAYEYFLQFNNELRLFWKTRWSLGKCLFLWNRYFSLLYVIAQAVDILLGHPTLQICKSFNGWNDVGQVLLVLSTQVVMVLRVYVMYENSKLVVGLFMLLIVGEVIFWIVFLVIGGYVVHYESAGTNNPFRGLVYCADGDMPHRHWYAFFDTPVLIIESMLVSLALYKAWQYHKSKSSNRILIMLTRESILYFVAVFAVYMIDQVLNYINRMTLDELVNGYRNAIPMILANRLMISIREAYYDHDFVDMDADRASESQLLQFAPSDLVGARGPEKTAVDV